MKLTVGMRVRLQPEAIRIRNLRDVEFTVRGPIVGTGRNTFVKLSGPDGGELPTWFRWNELRLLAHRHVAVRASPSGETADSLLARAHQLVADAGGSLQLSDALKRAATEDPQAAARHLKSFDASVGERAVTPEVPLSLHRHDDESFSELVERVAGEQLLEYRDAIRLVSRAYPALAQHYSARG
jgi:hypothetical protein